MSNMYPPFGGEQKGRDGGSHSSYRVSILVFPSFWAMMKWKLGFSTEKDSCFLIEQETEQVEYRVSPDKFSSNDIEAVVIKDKFLL